MLSLKEGKMEEQRRVVRYDVLRILSAYLVVLLHMSVGCLQQQGVGGAAWNAANILSALSRVSVPLFVMLSGAFLLDPSRTFSLSYHFKKRLPRLAYLFLGWSLFYAGSSAVYSWLKNKQAFDLHSFLRELVEGHYHMWYLYMLAGLYLITPILRVLCQHGGKLLLQYFIALCVLITSVTKLNEQLFHWEMLSSVLSKLSFFTAFGYVGYFVAGYYFKTYPPGEKARRLWFLGGALALLAAAWGTWILSRPAQGELNAVLYSYYAPTVFIMSFTVFILAAHAGKSKPVSERLGTALRRITPDMLTVYLLHPFLLEAFSGVLPLNSAWLLPVNALFIFMLSLIPALLYRAVFARRT